MPHKVNSELANKNQQNSKITSTSFSAVGVYSGPIPPAAELEQYEKVLPGSADRILSMAEKQSQHRQKMENTMLAANIESAKRGQTLGFVIFIITVGVGATLLFTDKSGWGFASILSAVVGIVGLFIYNRVDERKELKDKKNK